MMNYGSTQPDHQEDSSSHNGLQLQSSYGTYYAYNHHRQLLSTQHSSHQIPSVTPHGQFPNLIQPQSQYQSHPHPSSRNLSISHPQSNSTSSPQPQPASLAQPQAQGIQPTSSSDFYSRISPSYNYGMYPTQYSTLGSSSTETALPSLSSGSTQGLSSANGAPPNLSVANGSGQSSSYKPPTSTSSVFASNSATTSLYALNASTSAYTNSSSSMPYSASGSGLVTYGSNPSYPASNGASFSSQNSAVSNQSQHSSIGMPSLPISQSPAVPYTSSTVGQYQPAGLRPRVTTTMWEDEKTLCYQVDANSVSVVRRADNDMINGTKLLNVARMTRGRRDGILKLEKLRHVVKIGLMHLKGVWIPFDRALQMAQREGIVDLLYPLFVRDIKRVIQTGVTPTPGSAVVSSLHPSISSSENMSPSSPSASVSSARHVCLSGAQNSYPGLYRQYSQDIQQNTFPHPQLLSQLQPHLQPSIPVQSQSLLQLHLQLSIPAQSQLQLQSQYSGVQAMDSSRLQQHYAGQQYYSQQSQAPILFYQVPYQQNSSYSGYNSQSLYPGYAYSQVPNQQQSQAQELGTTQSLQSSQQQNMTGDMADSSAHPKSMRDQHRVLSPRQIQSLPLIQTEGKKILLISDQKDAA